VGLEVLLRNGSQPDRQTETDGGKRKRRE